MWLKLVRAHIIISGEVTGVGFRFHTRIKARNLGLRGWIRNLDSVEVEAVFEGEEDKVKEIIDWCKKGPDSALVKDVKVDFEEYTGEFEGFDVL
jgi:acylphosphatase